MLRRIRYVSQVAEGLSPDDVEALTFTSSANNERLGITGVLVTCGGVFLKVLEGPPEEVERVYDRIVTDVRHRHPLLLSDERVEERMFPDWFMRRIDLDDDEDERWEPLRVLLEGIVEQRSHVERMTDVLERAVWREAHLDR